MKNSPKPERQKAFCFTHYLNPGSDIHPEFVRFDFNDGQEYFDYGSHRHSDHELIYVESGEYRARVNGQRVKLSRGDMLLLCPHDLHEDRARKGLRYYSLSFRLRPGVDRDEDITLLDLAAGTDKKIIADAQRRILALMQEAAQAMQNPAPGCARLAHTLLHEIFWRLVQLIDRELFSAEFFRQAGSDDFAAGFYRALEENLNSSLELTELARALSMSQSQLSKLCRKHLRSSPARLALDFKLKRAQELLAKSDLTVREISERLNFRDQFSFSRAFKKNTGIPPLAFRSRRQRDPDITV